MPNELTLSTRYIPDGDYVHIIAAVVDSGEIVLNAVSGGVVDLFYERELSSSQPFTSEHFNADGELIIMFTRPPVIEPGSESVHVRVTADLVAGGSLVAVSRGMIEPTATVIPKNAPRYPPATPRFETDDVPQPAFGRQLQERDEDLTVLDAAADLYLLAATFVDIPVFEIGGTGWSYVGGGNRLLPSMDDDDLIYQDADKIPVEINAETVVEYETTNLLVNSKFGTSSSVPDGWSVTTTDDTITVQHLVTDVDVAACNEWSVRATAGAPWGGTMRGVTLTGPQCAVSDDTAALTFSLYVYAKLHTSDTQVLLLRLSLEAYDVGDALLGTLNQTFDMADVIGQRLLCELAVSAGGLPIGTSYVVPLVYFESLEGSDDITVSLRHPQVEAIPFATTRVPTVAVPVTRSSDIITVPDAESWVNVGEGTVLIGYVPRKDSVGGDAYFFDCRDGFGLNGFAGYHRASDGKLVFLVADGASITLTLVSTDPVTPGAGMPMEARFSWSTAFARIFTDNEVVASHDAAYTLPGSLGFNDLRIGRSYNPVPPRYFLQATIETFQVWRERSE